MSAMQFYVSREGEQQGPYSLDEIVAKVGRSELALTDYIYDESKEDWVLLMQHEALARRLEGPKPKAPPPRKAAEEAPPLPKAAAGSESQMVAEWFVLKGENKFGPFSYTDVVKMLQEKVIYEFDFAWNSGLSTWKRIAEIEAFHSDKIRQLKSTLMPEIQEVFFRRRHRRVSYGGTIIVHDNKSVWKGQGVEISAGGAGVVMENATVIPGQTLFLHFKPGDGVPPFNAICEVVSKQYVEGVKDKTAPIRYGLKFKSVSTQTQKFLQEFSKKGESSGKAAA